MFSNHIISTKTLQQNNNKLPENKKIASELGNKNDLKKYMKKVMPFVQTTKEKMADTGIDALNLSLDFSESDVLTQGSEYLRTTLDVSLQ